MWQRKLHELHAIRQVLPISDRFSCKTAMVATSSKESEAMSKIDTQPAKGLERRAFPIEFRQVDEGERSAWATVVTYNRTDDYGSVWVAGCFAESLRRKLPKATWSHNWSDIIGRVTEYNDGPDRLDVKIQFSDFNDVPRARQAWSQMKSGDVDEMSFGFERQKVELVDEENSDAVERIIKARMYEVSPVLVGAVPDTAVLSVRDRLRTILSDEQIVGLRDLLTEEEATTAKPEGEAETQEPIREPGDTGEEESPEEAQRLAEEEAQKEKEDLEALLIEALDAEALATKALVS